MAERFNMADLVAGLLGGGVSPSVPASGKLQATKQEGEGASPLPVVSEAAQRPVRRRPDGAAQAEVSSRQQQRDARAYAEGWWQAIREWDTRSNGGILVLGERGRSGSGRQMVPVVGNWQSTPYGIHRFDQVNTPMGWISETALSLACNASEVLSKLRDGGGRATLLHSNGRGWDGKEALGYGVQVLGLAVRLGDGAAIHHLELLNVGKNVTLFLELPQE